MGKRSLRFPQKARTFGRHLSIQCRILPIIHFITAKLFKVLAITHEALATNVSTTKRSGLSLSISNGYQSHALQGYILQGRASISKTNER